MGMSAGAKTSHQAFFEAKAILRVNPWRRQQMKGFGNPPGSGASVLIQTIPEVSTSISCDGGNGRGDGRNSGYGQRLSRGQRLRLIAGNPFDKLRGSMDLHGFTTVNRLEWLHGVQRQCVRLPFSKLASCDMQRNAEECTSRCRSARPDICPHLAVH